VLMGVTNWDLGALRVPLIMVPDNFEDGHYNKVIGPHEEYKFC
jgi:hypothetical protein